MPLDQCFGIPNNANNNKNNSSTFHLTEQNSDISKHSLCYIITGCAGVWVGSRRLQEETDKAAPTRDFSLCTIFLLLKKHSKYINTCMKNELR